MPLANAMNELAHLGHVVWQLGFQADLPGGMVVDSGR